MHKNTRQCTNKNLVTANLIKYNIPKANFSSTAEGNYPRSGKRTGATNTRASSTMQNSRKSSNSRIEACVLVDSAESCRVFSCHRVLLLMPHIQPHCCLHTGETPSSQRQQQQPSWERLLIGAHSHRAAPSSATVTHFILSHSQGTGFQ